MQRRYKAIVNVNGGENHRVDWDHFGWACSCGRSRAWPLAPLGRGRAAARRHQVAEERKAYAERRAMTKADMTKADMPKMMRNLSGGNCRMWVVLTRREALDALSAA